MSVSKRSVVVKKTHATRATREEKEKRENERLDNRMYNEVVMMQTQISFESSVFNRFRSIRMQTSDSSINSISSSLQHQKSFSHDRTISFNQSLMQNSSFESDNSNEENQISQTFQRSQSNQSSQISQSAETRRSFRTSVSIRRFEEHTSNQMTKLRKLTKRRSSFDSIHQNWNSNDVRRRYITNRTLNTVDETQIAAQRATYDSSNRFAIDENNDTNTIEDEMKDDDLENVREATKNDNYEIWTREQYSFKFRASLRVRYSRFNNFIKWFDSINNQSNENMQNNWFKNRFHVEILDLIIDDAKKNFNVSELVDITVIVKSNCNFVNNVTISLSDLSSISWIFVESQLIEMWRRQSNYELKINVQCVDSMNENIIATTIDQNIVQVDQNNARAQAFRNTRIVQLKRINIERNNQLEQADDFRAQLIEKWKCHSDICLNESNYCYSEDRNHYKLTNVHFETWANSIFDDKDEVSVEHSSALMLEHIKVI